MNTEFCDTCKIYFCFCKKSVNLHNLKKKDSFMNTISKINKTNLYKQIANTNLYCSETLNKTPSQLKNEFRKNM